MAGAAKFNSASRTRTLHRLLLDGTKLQADASSFQNYDRDRLEKAIGELEKQLQQMLVEAAGQDAAEDAAEQDRDDSATPPELRNRTHRLAKRRRLSNDWTRGCGGAAGPRSTAGGRETAPGRKGGPPGVRPPKRGGRGMARPT